MKKAIIIIIVMVFCVAPTLSMATLIQETWTGHVSYLNDEAAAYYQLNQIFTITVQYDDEGTVASEWSDGENGIAEFGMGDDGEAILSIPLEPENGQVWISDASIGFDDDTIDFMEHINDNTTVNNCFAEGWVHGQKDVNMFADGMIFYAVYGDPLISAMRIYASVGENTFSRAVEVEDIIVTDGPAPPMEPVPEPATMLLFGTGLAGLAGYRRRKAMKK